MANLTKAQIKMLVSALAFQCSACREAKCGLVKHQTCQVGDIQFDKRKFAVVKRLVDMGYLYLMNHLGNSYFILSETGFEIAKSNFESSYMNVDNVDDWIEHAQQH
jgi:hypothetical protein